MERAPVVFAEVVEVRMALREPFVTGFGSTDTRRTVLVHLRDADGAEGWGEAAALDHPFYLPDTTSGTFVLVCEWALPLALDGIPDPRAVARRLSHIRGNTFARAGVEAAFWCLEAVRRDSALAPVFAAEAAEIGTAGNSAVTAAATATAGPARPSGSQPVPFALRTHVPVGESIGIHETLDGTLTEVSQRLAEGYQRMKLKVMPGWDEEVVSAVRTLVGDNGALQVDANASYSTSDQDLARLAALDRYGLTCIEQPLGWDDLLGHAELQRHLATPICLDESLRTVGDVRRALELGACRNVNLKPGRVGGVTASLEIHALCAATGTALWCGGMLESGVGRAVNLALAALPGFTDPADMSPASVLYEYDLVDPTYEVALDGTIAVPTAPGLGFPLAMDRISDSTVRSAEVSPPR